MLYIVIESVISNYVVLVKLNQYFEFPTAKVHTLFIIMKYFPIFLTKFVSHFTLFNPGFPPFSI